MKKSIYWSYSDFDTLCDRWFSLDFEDYLVEQRKHLRKVRKCAGADYSDDTIEMNMPYYLPHADSEHGVLMIHGFLSSPYMLRALSKHYQSLGFHVISILLPGHGSVPGEIFNTRSQHWLRAAEYGYEQLAKKVKHVHLLGYSIGGLLSSLLAQQGKKANTLSLFVPAFGIHGAAHLLPLINQSTSWMPDHWLPKWLARLNEHDRAGYWSTSYRGALNVHRLIERFHQGSLEHLRELPTFITAIQKDPVVRYAPIIHFFQQNTSPNSKMILYERKERLHPDSRVVCINEKLLQDNMLGLSHVAPIVGTDDPHYGEHGTLFTNTHPDTVYGELIPQNLMHAHIRRTRYNPDLPNLLKELSAFLLGVE